MKRKVPKLYRKVLKGRPTMHSPTQPAYETPPTAANDAPRPNLSAERVYRGLTIAFMFLLLASLWLFR